MEFGVRAVLDDFLGGTEDILMRHAKRDGLVIERVVANMVSPTEIGYLCYPTPPDTCTPISVDVTATHLATATTDEITFALLRQSTHLPSLIDVDGYTIEYVGDRAVETNTGITISGVPDREMMGDELTFFEDVAREFLDKVAKSQENDSLQILGVKVNGQEITTGGAYAIDEADGLSATLPSMQKRNNAGRRLKKKSNNIKVSVKGKYRPPPEMNFGEHVESSINRDRELLQKELKDRKELAVGAGPGNGTHGTYFDEAEVVGARQIKEEGRDSKSLGALNRQVEDGGGTKGLLNIAAMVVGGLIVLLSLAFLLRPHRRRALFSSGYKDKRTHRTTQLVDADDGDRFVDNGTKNRAMIRGESLGDSGNSFPGSLQFSNFSAGGGGFDPRGSGGSLRSSGNRGPPGHPPANGPPGGSFTNGSLTGSFTSNPMNGSFAMPQQMNPGPYGPGGPMRNNSVRHGPPPPGQENFPHGSMPPMRGSPGGPVPAGPPGHMNRSMPPGGRGGRRPADVSSSFRRGPPSMTSSFQSGPPMGGGPPPPRGMHPGMAGSSRHLGGSQQMQDPRRSTRPQFGYN